MKQGMDRAVKDFIIHADIPRDIEKAWQAQADTTSCAVR